MLGDFDPARAHLRHAPAARIHTAHTHTHTHTYSHTHGAPTRRQQRLGPDVEGGVKRVMRRVSRMLVRQDPPVGRERQSLHGQHSSGNKTTLRHTRPSRRQSVWHWRSRARGVSTICWMTSWGMAKLAQKEWLPRRACVACRVCFSLITDPSRTGMDTLVPAIAARGREIIIQQARGMAKARRTDTERAREKKNAREREREPWRARGKAGRERHHPRHHATGVNHGEGECVLRQDLEPLPRSGLQEIIWRRPFTCSHLEQCVPQPASRSCLLQSKACASILRYPEADQGLQLAALT